MSISRKMMMSAGGAVLATIVIGAGGLYGMSRINGAIETQIAVGSLLKHHMAADLTRAIMVNDVEAAIRIGRLKRDAGPATIEAAKADIAQLDAHLVQAPPAILPAALGQELVDSHKALQDFAAQAQKIVEESFSDNYKANQDLEPFSKSSADLMARMGAVSDKLEALNAESAAGTTSVKNTLMTAMMAAIAAMIGGLILANYLIGRSVAVPVRTVTAIMGRMAGGERAVEMPAMNRTDEIGRMYQALSSFKESLSQADRKSVV